MRNREYIQDYLQNHFNLTESEAFNQYDELDYKNYLDNYIEDGFLINESVNLSEMQNIVSKNFDKFFNVFDDNEFLIANNETKELYTKKFQLLPTLTYDTSELTKNEVILFKLKPMLLDEKIIERAQKKGLREAIPSFDDIIKRAKDSKQFKSILKNPGIALYDYEGKTYNYQLNSNNLNKFDRVYTLPKIRIVRNNFTNYEVPVFILFDHIDRIKLGIRHYAGVLGALVGKKEEYKIDDKLLYKIWDLSIAILFGSLHTYKIEIDYIIVPSSMGKLISYYRDAFKTYFPNTKIITLKKPTLTELESFYSLYKDKYDKQFNYEVISSYKDKGVYDVYNPKDPFKNKNNEYYPNIIYVPDSEYENRNDETIKISKLPTRPHRQLMTSLMSDFIINSQEFINLSGNIILFDDDITTGATLVNFMYNTIKSSSKNINNIYVISMLSSIDNSLTDTGKFGIDKPLDYYNNNKSNKEELKIRDRLSYLINNCNTFNITELINELNSFSYNIFKIKSIIELHDLDNSFKKIDNKIIVKLKYKKTDTGSYFKSIIIDFYNFIINNFELNNLDKNILKSFTKE